MIQITHHLGLAHEVSVLEAFAEERIGYQRPTDPEMWQLDRTRLVVARLRAAGFHVRVGEGVTTVTR